MCRFLLGNSKSINLINFFTFYESQMSVLLKIVSFLFPIYKQAELVYNSDQNGFITSNDGPGHHNANQSPHESHESRDWSFEQNHHRLGLPESNLNPYSQGLSPTTAAWEVARQGAYGSGNQSDSSGFAADEHHQVNGVSEVRGGTYHTDDPQRLHHGIIRTGNYAENLDVDGEEEFGYNHIHSLQSTANSEDDRRYSQHYETPRSAKAKQAQNAQNHVEGWREQNRFRNSQEGQHAIRHVSSEPNMGQVHYQRKRGDDGDEARTDSGRMTMGVNGMGSHLPGEESDPYQAEFNHAGQSRKLHLGNNFVTVMRSALLSLSATE